MFELGVFWHLKINNIYMSGNNQKKPSSPLQQQPHSVTLGKGNEGAANVEQQNFGGAQSRDVEMTSGDAMKSQNAQDSVEDIEVNGDVPQARFGHTITVVAKQKVVMFGGATGDTGKYSMTGETFIFNILNKQWQKLQGKRIQKI